MPHGKVLKLESMLLLAMSGLAFAQTTADPADKPLPELYVLKVDIQEKERVTREAKIQELRKFIMVDIEQAEQAIAAEACKAILAVDTKDCNVYQDQKTGKLMIGYRPGYKAQAPPAANPKPPTPTQNR